MSNMEYNTTRLKLHIPEYGRNVQKMIEKAIDIEDREKRTETAYYIIEIMSRINPGLKEYSDFRHKLWDHLYIISDFKLDVNGEYPPPEETILEAKPKRVSYPIKKIKYKHYGINLERIVKKAADYDEGPEKDALVKAVTNHMKKLYLMWNRDTVKDELIFEQVMDLSDKKIIPDESFQLTPTSDILARIKKKKENNPKSRSYKKGKKRRR